MKNNAFLNQPFAQMWGTPRGLYMESHGILLEISFLAALLFHITPLTLLWNMERSISKNEPITLQNVELIETEQERTPMPAAEKPKSAFEFLKMALPIFNKTPEIQTPKDIITIPKTGETTMAEPAKLIEKKGPALSKAPEIRLDRKISGPGPEISEIGKHAVPSQAGGIKFSEPALKLEERPSKQSLPAIQAANLGSKKNSLSLEPIGYSRGMPAQSPIIQNTMPEKEGKISADTIEIPKEKVKIVGPLSKRSVVQSYIPEYPAWARAKNVEADVSVRFYVSEEGTVRSNMVIETTSGYADLDRMVLDALKKWKFSPISSSGQDQWGIITFRFRLG